MKKYSTYFFQEFHKPNISFCQTCNILQFEITYQVSDICPLQSALWRIMWLASAYLHILYTTRHTNENLLEMVITRSTNDFFSPYQKLQSKNKTIKRKPTLHWAASMKYNYRNMNSFVKVVRPFRRSLWWEQKPVEAQTACANSNIITVSRKWIRPVGQII